MKIICISIVFLILGLKVNANPVDSMFYGVFGKVTIYQPANAPDIEIDKPLCEGSGLTSHALKEGKAYYLEAATIMIIIIKWWQQQYIKNLLVVINERMKKIRFVLMTLGLTISATGFTQNRLLVFSFLTFYGLTVFR